MADRLWGTTRYRKHKVLIYLHSDEEWENDGETDLRHGVVHMVLRSGVISVPKELRRLLVHEFTHVVEYLNDPKYLSPELDAEDCTTLAQTMEAGLTDLLTNLKVGKRKFKW